MPSARWPGGPGPGESDDRLDTAGHHRRVQAATDFFEKSAAEANKHGFDVEIISRSPATHTAFADQVGIIEDYIQRKVDVIVISPIKVDIIQPV